MSVAQLHPCVSFTSDLHIIACNGLDTAALVHVLYSPKKVFYAMTHMAAAAMPPYCLLATSLKSCCQGPCFGTAKVLAPASPGSIQNGTRHRTGEKACEAAHYDFLLQMQVLKVG